MPTGPWVYDNNNNLINNRPFSSIILASKYLNIDRKSIARYLDTDIQLPQGRNNLKFYSSSK